MKRCLKCLWIAAIVIGATLMPPAATLAAEKSVDGDGSNAISQTESAGRVTLAEVPKIPENLRQQLLDPKRQLREMPQRSFWDRIPKNALIEAFVLLLAVLYIKYRKRLSE